MNTSQLYAILWLRWRLTKNQLSRGGTLNAVAGVLLLVILIVTAAGLAAGGFALGLFFLPKQPPRTALMVWDAVAMVFLIFWLTGLLVEIQRSESIDLTKLLHLPMSLRQVFLFNYLMSLASPGVVLFAAAGVGICVGTVFGCGLGMIWGVPLLLGFLFMLTAWTYWLRGWLAALMVNKRRRRTVIALLTVAVVLMGQVPNLLMNTPALKRARQAAKAGQSGEKRNVMLDAHLVLPPGWIGYGTMRLREGNPWPAASATLACMAIGSLGLLRAYNSTLSFYQAKTRRTRRNRASQKAYQPPKRLLVQRALPYCRDDTAALALATLRSLLRAPEMRMALLMPLIVVIAIVSTRFAKASAAVGPFGALALAGAAAFGAFTFAPMLGNMFGLDRDGFRALILLPTPRDRTLLGKNLGFFPFVGTITIVIVTLVKFGLQVGWWDWVAALVQTISAFLCFSIAGNLTSIVAPYRISAGTLQAKKLKPMVLLVMFASMLTLPFLTAPVILPPAAQLLFAKVGWLPGWPVNLLLSCVSLFLVVCLYRALLPFQGRLLQIREQKILEEVTAERE